MSKTALGVTLILLLMGTSTSALAVSGGSWIWVMDTITGDFGEAVVGTGECIYIAREPSFYCYRPADDTWTMLAAPPNPDAGDALKTGTALAWDHSDHIYALYGAATRDSRRWFYRYSISYDHWEALQSTPYDQGEGDAITWCGLDGCIYATIGGEQRDTYFVRYDPSTNSWSDAPANPLAGMGDGASLVWTGDSLLYALRGEDSEASPLCDFWCYDLSDDSWEDTAPIPESEGVGDGASLLWIGNWVSEYSDYIFALGGGEVDEDPGYNFYRYSISDNEWEQLESIPCPIGYYVGNRLGFAGGHIYYWQGAPSTWACGGKAIYTLLIVPDATSPAAVTDLATSNPTTDSITLTWIAPGDDGNTGTASEYDVRYSTEPITEANWAEATQYEVVPIPQPAGSSESLTVTGLDPDTTYYFALKTADEVPNWSELSNVAEGTTGSWICPIALTLHGSELAPEGQLLRGFRDQIVLSTFTGNQFMQVFNAWYYSFSPSVANFIAQQPVAKTLMKGMMYPLIGILHFSSMAYSAFAFSPQLGVVVAGLAASSLIGVVYFTLPATMLLAVVKRLRKKTLKTKQLKLLTITWLVSLALMILGEITLSPAIMMAATASFVITTLSSSATIIASKIIQRFP